MNAKTGKIGLVLVALCIQIEWLFCNVRLVCPTQWLNSAGTGRNGVPQPVSGVPPPEIAVPAPKVVAPPPGDALMVHTVFVVS